MGNVKFGVGMAVREHLAEGLPLTRLEAIALFGVSNLTTIISSLRREGWQIESQLIPYAHAVVRLNKHITFHPPQNLPFAKYCCQYRLKK